MLPKIENNPTTNPAALAKKEGPDFIIMDIIMPVMDGYTATRFLKLNESTKKIPVIGMGNMSEEQDIQRANNSGMDEYLITSKLTPAEILHRITLLSETFTDPHFKTRSPLPDDEYFTDPILKNCFEKYMGDLLNEHIAAGHLKIDDIFKGAKKVSNDSAPTLTYLDYPMLEEMFSKRVADSIINQTWQTHFVFADIFRKHTTGRVIMIIVLAIIVFVAFYWFE